jgi:hypothetical protein
MSSVNLKASKATVAEFRQTQELLRSELESIARMTKEYPVVCTFAGYRFVFESRDDVLALIAKLDVALDEFQKAA